MPNINDAYLSLGSNLGDRRGFLRSALHLLSANGELKAISSIYETDSWGYVDQNSYFNLACQFETKLTALELMKEIEVIESLLGRKRNGLDGARYTAREIDIDILFFGDLSIDTEALKVPHPRLELRNFVLQPMAEIAPDLKHPVSGYTMQDLLHLSPDDALGVRLENGL